MSDQTKKTTILIIDDNITNLKVAMTYLQAYSFEILVARNGADGLESAQIAQPQLILLDVQMLGLDGFEVCRRLKANPETKQIPIIFMTALTDTNDKVRGLELGAVDYVTKPIESSELLARVNIHLQLQALQKQLRQANEDLEEKVRQRTAVLQEEITLRKKQEAEKDALLKTMTRQSEQLRNLTQVILENQQKQQQGLTQQLEEQVQQQLYLLKENLRTVQTNLAHASIAEAHLQDAQAILKNLQTQTQQVTDNLTETTAVHQNLLQNPLFILSAREREVFQLLTLGKSRAEIADLLVVSPGTVSTYRSRIIDKLGVDDNAGLMKLALHYELAETWTSQSPTVTG